MTHAVRTLQKGIAMKDKPALGVLARFTRRIRPSTMNLFLFGGLFSVVAFAPSSSSPVLVAQCIPMNNRFVGPLRPLVREIIGGIGGLIPLLLSILIIILVIVGMIKILRNEEMSGVIKGIIAIPAVLLVGIAVLIVVNAAIAIFNGQCGSNPF